jgi:hypothetical protein
MRARDRNVPLSVEDDPILAELAALVAETRPEPDAGRSARIDTRVARALAPAPQLPLRPRRRRLLQPALGLCAAAVVAIAVGLAANAGMDGSNDSGSSSSPAGAGSESAESGGGSGAGAASDAGAGSSGGGGEVDTAAPVPAIGVAPAAPGAPAADGRTRRKVERAATMTLGARARDVDAVAGGVSRVTAQLGGFVASSSVAGSEGGTLDLRVPSARFDDAIARLSRLARVRRLERSTLDITAQAVSARARIADAKAERKGLRRQLAAAWTAVETARIRDRLQAVSRRLERLRAQARRVDNRAAYANIGVTLVAERRDGGGAGTWTPKDALHDALRVLEVIAGVLLIALAVLLPLAVLTLLAHLARRALGHARRERALDAA